MNSESPESGYVWFNGEVQRAADVRISPFDRGFLVGEGVFETMAAHAGKVFAFDRHMRRLERGCELLTIAVPDMDALSRGVTAVLEANDLTKVKARVRITVSGGAAPLGAHFESATPTIIIAASPCTIPDGPAKLVSVPFTRNERGAMVGVKTCSYAENLVALEVARNHGADDAILCDSNGSVAEGAISNLFTVEHSVVVTPSLASGCLPGVTREIVLELCADLGIEAREQGISKDRFAAADEVFITSSIRGVQAVGEVDGRSLDLHTESVTARLAEAYRSLIAG